MKGVYSFVAQPEQQRPHGADIGAGAAGFELKSFVLHYLLTILPVALMLGILQFLFASSQDVSQFFKAMRYDSSVLTPWISVFSKFGNVIFYFVYAALAFQRIKNGDRSGLRLLLCYAFFQVLIVTCLGQFLKIAVGKPRPFNDGPYVHFEMHSKNHSFVSGHTAEMSGAVLPLSLLYKKAFLSLFFGCIIAAMACSRLYLGQHHLADIWVGLLLGSMSAICTVIVWRKWSMRNEQRVSREYGVNGSQRPSCQPDYGVR